MDRRLRLALVICLPLAAALGIVSSRFDWSIGYIYLAFFAVTALTVFIGTHDDRRRSRSRRR